jgi:hypothetical protein
LEIKTLREMPMRKNRKEKQHEPMVEMDYSQSNDGTEKDPTYSPEMQELSPETCILSKHVKKEIIKEKYLAKSWYQKESKKYRRSIDLNKSASEED